ncbi:MAG: hypothetical protein JKY88_14585 [Pseudomonadales bacterium]|nr:hypothetical protein [Pseudomonadales bacterium]
MNIIPPTGYGRAAIPIRNPTRTPPRRLSATNNNKCSYTQGERRRHEERRQHASTRQNAEFSMEMRQVGDRRSSNRLFVTT